MTKCKRLIVPKECCYISFGDGDFHEGNDSFTTIRDEDMIFDLDVKGKVIGIELLSSKKAKKGCMG